MKTNKPNELSRTSRRSGAALMVVIFVLAITSAVVVSMLDTATTEMALLNNTVDYDRALYLAGAGAHHALAELEADITWRTGISSTELPAGSGNYYAATAVDGTGTEVVVTATGTSGGITRTVEVTVAGY